MKTPFEEKVSIKYDLFNSLFLNLPFSGITDTGHLLPLLHKECEYGVEKKMKPAEIIDLFFTKHGSDFNTEQQIDLLFRFVQYIERQVVLFDAIEDSSFETIHNLKGSGTLHALLKERNQTSERKKLLELFNNYAVRIVLTAHPTQFYPGNVLSIITDLEKAIRKNDLQDVQDLLQQLGRTRFYKRQKPTPLDEAISLIWYLESVFYDSIGSILSVLDNEFDSEFHNNRIIELGFWPGGDRDGNPFVDDKTTLETAALLRKSILRSYMNHLQQLKRRITFPGAELLIRDIEKQLRKAYEDDAGYKDPEEFISDIKDLKKILKEENNSLYLDRITDLERRVSNFGFYFATMDLRQDSRVHHSVVCDILSTMGVSIPDYESSDFDGKAAIHEEMIGSRRTINYGKVEEITARTLRSIEALIEIQRRNGETACNRYIISNTQNEDNLIELLFLLRLVHQQRELKVDLLPLFETIDDLKAAPEVMRKLYSNKIYRAHLRSRGDKQTIMLGFSDGTKDGGYFTANWSIFKAKENLSSIANEFGIELLFFDGRGGPPARGGGKTHAFYSSLPDTIQNNGIHLTVQGQTISSNFGTKDAAKYNLEQLLTAGLSNSTEGMPESAWSMENREIIQELSDASYEAYMQLRNDEDFLDYLSEMTVLRFYGLTNIGSRPSKRSKSDKLSLENLRAIPYVGSWSQMKQNVPGYYGLGIASQKLMDSGRLDQLRKLYQTNRFFKALLSNSMQSLAKTNFTLTNYLENHSRFGKFWKQIEKEYERSIDHLLNITEMRSLMSDSPDGKSSIILRQKIILPLLVIQQTAMMKLQDDKTSDEDKLIWQKLIIRCFFGNINATRNAA